MRLLIDNNERGYHIATTHSLASFVAESQPAIEVYMTRSRETADRSNSSYVLTDNKKIKGNMMLTTDST